MSPQQTITITMNAPAAISKGGGITAQLSDGTPLVISAAGTVTVDSRYLAELERMGFTKV